KLGGGDDGVIRPSGAEVQRVALETLIKGEAAAGGEQHKRDRSDATHAARMPPCGLRSQPSSFFFSRLPPRRKTSTRSRATPSPRGNSPESQSPSCRMTKSSF